MDSTTTFIEPLSLRDAIVSKATDFIVVDVRDDDHHGGHIAGSINAPSSSIMWDPADDATLRRFVQSHADKKTVVFHCMKSQVRGPKCSLIFQRVLCEELSKGEAVPSVKVLRGGYEGFRRRFADDPEASLLFESV